MPVYLIKAVQYLVSVVRLERGPPENFFHADHLEQLYAPRKKMEENSPGTGSPLHAAIQPSVTALGEATYAEIRCVQEPQ